MVCLRAREHMTSAGREIEALKMAWARGAHDSRLPCPERVEDMLAQIDAVTPETLPPVPFITEITVEVLCLRLGGSSRNDAWASIGVGWQRGRRFVRGVTDLDWPIWFTLHDAAVGSGRALFPMK